MMIANGRVTSLSPFMLAEPTTGIPATPVGGLGMSLVTMLSIMAMANGNFANSLNAQSDCVFYAIVKQI